MPVIVEGLSMTIKLYSVPAHREDLEQADVPREKQTGQKTSDIRLVWWEGSFLPSQGGR